MKAWHISVKDEFYATVLFAETRGKAKSLALHTDTCEDAQFTDIEVCRMPQFDKYYEDGKVEFDWDNPKDRLLLVKEGGFSCGIDLVDYDECPYCSAKEYCHQHQDYLRDMEEDA
jgi:hypothetical protein